MQSMINNWNQAIQGCKWLICFYTVKSS